MAYLILWMQEIDLINGPSFLGSCFLWAVKYFSKCAVAESRAMCDSWVAAQIHWIGFYGTRTQGFQEIPEKKKVRVTHWFNAVPFRAPTQTFYWQGSVRRPALRLQWSHQPCSSGEPRLEIGVPECHIAVSFWGCWSLTLWPLCACSSGLRVSISICGSSSLLESYTYTGHVHCREERESWTRTRNSASCYVFFSFHKSK